MVIVFCFLNLCNCQTLFFMGLISRIHAFESSMLIKKYINKGQRFWVLSLRSSVIYAGNECKCQNHATSCGHLLFLPSQHPLPPPSWNNSLIFLLETIPIYQINLPGLDMVDPILDFRRSPMNQPGQATYSILLDTEIVSGVDTWSTCKHFC